MTNRPNWFRRLRYRLRHEPVRAGVCPFCGGTDDIYSYYRDGGSTLYHRPCGGERTWANPEWPAIRESMLGHKAVVPAVLEDTEG